MVTIAPSRDVADLCIWSKEKVAKLNRFLDRHPLFQPVLPVLAILSKQAIGPAMCVDYQASFEEFGEPPLDAVIATFLVCREFSIHLVDALSLWSEYITTKLVRAAASPQGLSMPVCRMLLWSQDEDAVPRMQRTYPWHVLLAALTMLVRTDYDASALLLKTAKQVIFQVGWVMLSQPVRNRSVNEAAKDKFVKLPLDLVATLLSDDRLCTLDTELNVVGLCHLWWSRQSDKIKCAAATAEMLSACVRLPLLGRTLADRVLGQVPWASNMDVPKFFELCEDLNVDVPSAWQRRQDDDTVIKCVWYTADTMHMSTVDVQTTDLTTCLRYGLVWELCEDYDGDAVSTTLCVKWPEWADFLPLTPLKVSVRLQYTRPEDEAHEHEYTFSAVPGRVPVKSAADDERGREHVSIAII